VEAPQLSSPSPSSTPSNGNRILRMTSLASADLDLHMLIVAAYPIHFGTFASYLLRTNYYLPHHSCSSPRLPWPRRCYLLMTSPPPLYPCTFSPTLTPTPNLYPFPFPLPFPLPFPHSTSLPFILLAGSSAAPSLHPPCLSYSAAKTVLSPSSFTELACTPP
jgi:hypothetical protein